MTETRAIYTTQNELATKEPTSRVKSRFLANANTQKTRAGYAGALNHFEEFLGGVNLDDVPDSDWAQLDPALLSAYREWFNRRISPKTERPYSGNTKELAFSVVRGLLTEAMYLGLYPADQLEYVRKRVLKPTDPGPVHHSAISRADQERILSHAGSQPGLKGIRDYALFRLWLDTGLRRSELVGLKVGDCQAISGRRVIVVRQTKGGDPRVIDIDQATGEALKAWIQAAGQTSPGWPLFCQVRKVGRGPEAEYVIPDIDNVQSGNEARSKHLHPDSIAALVEKYCKELGIDGVTAHSFRVSLVTDMLADDAPLDHLMRVTGHKTPGHVINTYNRNRRSEPITKYRKRPLPARK